MAKKLKVGDVIRDYQITKVFGPGMMAISYAAVRSDGQKVFFKQYKSPAPTVVWYAAFLAYQKELSRRVISGKAARFAVHQLDAFEEIWGGRCYFQAYEFVENGADLQKILDIEREQHLLTKLAPLRNPAVWARHVTWAKVLVAAVAALHESKVVHADLKPANAYLLEDPTISSGYQLKLIDMDFSLLSDSRAPWHGHQGYVGTDNYRSPEHMIRGGSPIPASDVFTCGLMLYELLAGAHPYGADDPERYAGLVRAYTAKPPRLAGIMPAPAENGLVATILHRALSPDPSARPSAAELAAALSGRGASHIDARSKTATEFSPSSKASGERRAIIADRIELAGADGRSLTIGIRTELGYPVLQHLGDEAAFWDAKQCILDRGGDRRWLISPINETTNETLLNGEALRAVQTLCEGDVIAVGRQSKRIIKSPLIVRGRTS